MVHRRRTQAKHLILKGRFVFPVAGEPIPDGSVTIEGTKIVAVGPCGAGVPPARRHLNGESVPQEVRDLGNVAILPGLVNAHVHLDFSDLAAPLGEPKIQLVPLDSPRDRLSAAFVRRRAAVRGDRPGRERSLRRYHAGRHRPARLADRGRRRCAAESHGFSGIDRTDGAASGRCAGVGQIVSSSQQDWHVFR